MLRTRLLSLAVAVGLCISALPVISATAAIQTVGLESTNAAVTGSAVVAEAKKFLGSAYSYSGDSPANGFSCIGFVWYVYHELGMNIPGTNAAAYRAYPQVSEADLEPGDLVFFQGTFPGLFPSHVAIYIGGGKIIHSENPTYGVTITDLRNGQGGYFQEHYLSAERPWTRSGSTGGVKAPHHHHVLIVSVTSLNMRSGPSLAYSVMTVLSRGTRLTVEGWTPGWVRVATPSGTVGWVERAGVSRGGSYRRKAGHPLSTGAKHLAWARAKTVYVTGLRVHSAPSLYAQVIFDLVRGNRVGVESRLDGWDKVVTARGASGYVVGKYLGRHRVRTHPRHVVKFRHPMMSGVNLHSAPSFQAGVVAVTNGYPVRVMHWQPGWAEIELSTRTVGWVSRAYLGRRHSTRRAVKTAAPVRRAKPVTTSRYYVTATVRVHATPSLTAAIIGYAYAGTHVKILRTGEFDYVRTSSGQHGYVDAAYIA